MQSKELKFRGKGKVEGPPPKDSAGLGSGKAFHERERPVKGGDYKHNSESEVRVCVSVCFLSAAGVAAGCLWEGRQPPVPREIPR